MELVYIIRNAAIVLWNLTMVLAIVAAVVLPSTHKRTSTITHQQREIGGGMRSVFSVFCVF